MLWLANFSAKYFGCELYMDSLSLGVQILITQLMSRWKIRLSYVEREDVGEVGFENGIIQVTPSHPCLS